MIREIQDKIVMEKNGNIVKMTSMSLLMITTAPFLSAGNQSIKRTIQGLINQGWQIELWLLNTQFQNVTIDGVKIKTFSIPSCLNFILQPLLKSLKSQNFKKRQPIDTYQDICKQNEKFGCDFHSKKGIRPLGTIIDYRNDEVNQWLITLPIVFYFVIYIFIYGLKNFSKVQRFHVVWGYERGGILPALIIAKLFQLPFITSFQGTALKFYFQRYGILITFFKLPLDVITTLIKSNLVIMTDDGTNGLDTLLSLGHKKSKILFLPNGIDPLELSNIQPIKKSKLGLNGNELLFVVSSRLVPPKRIDRAVQLSANLITNGFNNFKLYIIGDGKDRDYLEQLVKNLEISQYVVFLGALSYRKSLEIIASADMIWSFQEYSNLTNTIQDALAYGKYVMMLDDNSLEGFLLLSPAISHELILKVPLENFLKIATDLIMRWSLSYKILESTSFALEDKNIWTWDKRMKTIEDQLLKLTNMN